MLRWKDIQVYADEAITRFTNMYRNISFIGAGLAPNNPDKYLIYLDDKKLAGTFRVIITEEFLNDQTQAIDLAAKIPSNFPEEKKVVLRIAYAILVAWQRHFIEAYKQVAPNKYDVTFTNAKNWYDSLK